MLESLSQLARLVLHRSTEEAAELGHSYIDTRHLLIALVAENETDLSAEPSIAAEALRRVGLDAGELRATTVSGTETIHRSHSSGFMSTQFKDILMEVVADQARYGRTIIGPEHLLIRLLSMRDCFAVDILRAHGIEPLELRAVVLSRIDQDDAVRINSSTHPPFA